MNDKGRRLLEALTKTDGTSRIVEEAIARNIVWFRAEEKGVAVAGADLAQESIRLVREEDVKHLFVETALEFLDRLDSFFVDDQARETILPPEVNDQFVQLIETIIVWGVHPFLSSVVIKNFEDRSASNLVPTRRSSNETLPRRVAQTFLDLFSHKLLLDVLGDYMIDVYALFAQLSLSHETLRATRRFLPTELSLNALLQLISINTSPTPLHHLRTELTLLVMETNALPFLLHTFSTPRFADHPDKTAAFLLFSLPPPDLEAPFLLSIHSTFPSLLSSRVLSPEQLTLLFHIIIPTLPLPSLISTLLLSPLASLLSLSPDDLLSQKHHAAVYDLKSFLIFINVATSLNDSFLSLLDSTPFDQLLIKLVLSLSLSIPHSALIAPLASTLSFYLSLHSSFDHFSEQLLLLLPSSPDPLLIDFFKLLSFPSSSFPLFLLSLLSHSNQSNSSPSSSSSSSPSSSPLPSSPLPSSSSEFIALLVLSLLSSSSTFLDSPLPFLPVFSSLLSSPHAHLTLSFLQMHMKTLSSSPSLPLHQTFLSQLLPSILSSDGSLYSSIFAFLSLPPPPTSTSLASLLSRLSSSQPSSLPLLLTELRSSLISASSINPLQASSAVSSIISFLLSSQDESIQTLLISSLSLLSLHTNIIPPLLALLTPSQPLQTLSLLFELLISVIVHLQQSISHCLPDIIGACSHLVDPHVIPLLLMVLLYILQNVKNAVFTSSVAQFLLDVLHAADLHDQDTTRAAAHLLRALVDVVDHESVATAFSVSQLSFLSSTASFLAKNASAADRDGITFVRDELARMLQFQQNKDAPRFLF